MAIIIEKVDSREATVGVDSPSVDLRYSIIGTENDAEVRALVESASPVAYAGLLRQSYRISHQGGGVWEASVRYGPIEPKETGQSSISFETSGSTVRITQSIATIGRHAPAGEQAPDFQGAIGASTESVEGTDITIPVYQWTETHYVPAAIAETSAFKATLFALTGHVNNAPFKGFATGEVLFLGANGSARGVEDWEVSYKFAASPNVYGLTIGGNIHVPVKQGWHYLWIRYEDDEDPTAKRLIKRPKAVYVEQVYYYGDFSLLGIGV